MRANARVHRGTPYAQKPRRTGSVDRYTRKNQHRHISKIPSGTHLCRFTPHLRYVPEQQIDTAQRPRRTRPETRRVSIVMIQRQCPVSPDINRHNRHKIDTPRDTVFYDESMFAGYSQKRDIRIPATADTAGAVIPAARGKNCRQNSDKSGGSSATEKILVSIVMIVIDSIFLYVPATRQSNLLIKEVHIAIRL